MAGTLNKVMLIGNLTRDPELKKTTGGQSVCTFSIATNRSYTDASGQRKDQVEYHNIVTWAKLAEICGQYLVKGKKVYIDGRLQTREWDGQDGQKKYRTEVVAENMIMLDRAGGPGGSMSAPSAAATALADAPVSNPDDEIKLEDIPF
ncbi:single-stranded DNA-binding protein [bacterium]|nr:single-stranded DNA-binding protein [bacterium]NBX49067.1 single-stranded DNA-binding protein [bacterium]